MTHVAFNIAGYIPYVWTIRKVMPRSLTDFSVKRVTRKLNDPNRSYIRCYCGNLFEEVYSILSDAHRASKQYLPFDPCEVVETVEMG